MTAILMWGSGDGAAALVGHRFGKHHIKLPLADRKKTWEGSGAMAAVSAVVGTASLLILTALPWHCCLLMALAASIFGAYTELISWGGDDTVTVPVVN
ncbi:MAG: phosphatidate cytidylyltransferase, partial [Oscillospiraceae bacterium]|nr:phosphatidate cytidylyltransferase [Oscillospiraceae bacterium]